MNNAKPTPIISEKGKKICPVCGKSSYSREGIHPQCAVQLTDAPRQQRLLAEKKRLAKVKKKPRQKSLNKKCPKCHIEIHVRRAICDCGHHFDRK